LTLSSTRGCRLPLGAVSEELRRAGHSVEVSADAGRFVCNWVYYHSLMAQDGRRRPPRQRPWESLFVHVPSFEHIPREEQIKFAADLLLALSRGEDGASFRDLPKPETLPADGSAP